MKNNKVVFTELDNIAYDLYYQENKIHVITASKSFFILHNQDYYHSFYNRAILFLRKQKLNKIYESRR